MRWVSRFDIGSIHEGVIGRCAPAEVTTDENRDLGSMSRGEEPRTLDNNAWDRVKSWTPDDAGRERDRISSKEDKT